MFIALTVSKVLGGQNGTNIQNFEFLFQFRFCQFFSLDSFNKISTCILVNQIFPSPCGVQDKRGWRQPEGANTQNNYFKLDLYAIFSIWSVDT